ncbi:BTB/POZ domain-containing protein KCTD3 [Trichinella patagoniensis]|uniref:BTB/POZ domain-containing protein KCTD3 n=1 Tax=Trichinella patagoniensis TaxID=990121 RepID=A0A0V0ZBC2_9BILA|nr:BTB/POZ domain-containing protein KCTD3 [Trichinella patagoniensis]
MLIANFYHSIHVRHIAHQVDNEQRFRLRADRFFHDFWCCVQSDRINVHQLNIQFGQQWRPDLGWPCQSWHQDLIARIQHFARSHGQRHRAEQIGRRTAVHHHRMTDAYRFGKIPFEALHLGTHGVHHFIHTVRWYAKRVPVRTVVHQSSTSLFHRFLQNSVHRMLPIAISIHDSVHFVCRFAFIQIQFGHIPRKNYFTLCDSTIPAVRLNIVKVNVCCVGLGKIGNLHKDVLITERATIVQTFAIITLDLYCEDMLYVDLVVQSDAYMGLLLCHCWFTMALNGHDALIKLNVGGVQFVTSRNTLMWISDTFFTSMLSGRIPAVKDENGAIFIDRDPKLFQVILNYMRSKQVDLKEVNPVALKHEAQFYGLTPLVKRLVLCDKLDQSACGDVLFHGYFAQPSQVFNLAAESVQPLVHRQGCHTRNKSEPICIGSRSCKVPGAVRLCSNVVAGDENNPTTCCASVSSSRNTLCPTSSLESLSSGNLSKPFLSNNIAALRNKWKCPHRPGFSGDFTKQLKQLEIGSKQISGRQSKVFICLFKKIYPIIYLLNGDFLLNVIEFFSTEALVDPFRVRIIRAHHSWIAVAYSETVVCYKSKGSMGWCLGCISPRTERPIRHLAISCKNLTGQGCICLAVSLDDNTILLWSVNDAGVSSEIGRFSVTAHIDALLFIASQLVALSKKGKIVVWHGMTQNWQIQDVTPICSYDTAGSFLLLGCSNGSIYYIDMQKFPLRMKDNDLLVMELHRDPLGDAITAVNIYLTPKSSMSGNWLEIAYGTNTGAVRIIAQHPETAGHSPQLFQTFTVHRARISRVALTAGHLISVCSEYNHVRSWSLTRFRGMINTQPGSTPLASFKVMTLESADGPMDTDQTSDVGPYGDKDSEQVFVQKVVPDTSQLYIRLASTGERVCVIKSVDGSSISSYLVHECEWSSGTGACPRRFLFTGHNNGSVQVWDLTTALEMLNARRDKPGYERLEGPTPNELLQLIDEFEITYQSLSSTPSSSISCLPADFDL